MMKITTKQTTMKKSLVVQQNGSKSCAFD